MHCTTLSATCGTRPLCAPPRPNLRRQRDTRRGRRGPRLPTPHIASSRMRLAAAAASPDRSILPPTVRLLSLGPPRATGRGPRPPRMRASALVTCHDTRHIVSRVSRREGTRREGGRSVEPHLLLAVLVRLLSDVRPVHIVAVILAPALTE